HFNNRPITAKITLTDPETKNVYELNSEDSVEGQYVCALDFETEYKLRIEAPGYNFVEKSLNIDYRADIFQYVMDIVPKREEVIELVESIAMAEKSQMTELDNNEFKDDSDITGPTPTRLITSEEASQIEPETQVTTGIDNINEENEQSSPYEKEIKETSTSENSTTLGQKRRLIPIEILSSTLKKGEVPSEITKTITEEGSEVIFITKIESNEQVIIPMIQFGFDEFGLSDDARADLDNLSDFLRKNENLVAILGGHTDSIGWNNYNRDLSLFRAGGVRLYLISKGVNQNQLRVIPMAETAPILSNSSFMGRKINRRVGMTFIDINDPIYQDPPFDSILQSMNLEIQPVQGYKTPHIVWEKIPVSIHFTKNNASFLTEYSRRKLDQLLNYINVVPFRLVITGYMDPNDENSELNLPEERARSVVSYLTSKGVAGEKLISLENKNFDNYFDILDVEPGISRRRVQFYLIKN
ncbi:OmpA family protein, partial [Bacteroidota bacterium]